MADDTGAQKAACGVNNNNGLIGLPKNNVCSRHVIMTRVEKPGQNLGGRGVDGIKKYDTKGNFQSTKSTIITIGLLLPNSLGGVRSSIILRQLCLCKC